MTVYESFMAARLEKKASRRRAVPLLALIAAYLGRKLPTFKKLRSAVLQIGAFVFLDYAAYQWHHIVGFAAIGVSLFVLEWLMSGDS